MAKNDVFISYSRKDKELVIPFVVRFKKELNQQCQIDEGDLLRGNQFDGAVLQSIKECQLFLLMLSTNSIRSERVRSEVIYAIQEGKRIVPVLVDLDISRIPSWLKILVGNFSHFDIRSGEQVIELFEKIKTWLSTHSNSNSIIGIPPQRQQIEVTAKRYSKMQHDVFISYSRKDLEKVKTIKAVIEHDTGADCWRDLEDISTDEEDYLDKIVEGIENCKVFIFMLSKYSQESEHAIGELLAAKKQRKKTGVHVVIVNIDKCEMNMKFTVRFSVKNMIVWDDQSQRDKLLKDIKRWTRQPATPVVEFTWNKNKKANDEYPSGVPLDNNEDSFETELVNNNTDVFNEVTPQSLQKTRVQRIKSSNPNDSCHRINRVAECGTDSSPVRGTHIVLSIVVVLILPFTIECAIFVFCFGVLPTFTVRQSNFIISIYSFINSKTLLLSSQLSLISSILFYFPLKIKLRSKIIWIKYLISTIGLVLLVLVIHRLFVDSYCSFLIEGATSVLLAILFFFVWSLLFKRMSITARFIPF